MQYIKMKKRDSFRPVTFHGTLNVTFRCTKLYLHYNYQNIYRIIYKFAE